MNFKKIPTDNPYSLVLKSFIHDQSLSPNCRWLLIYVSTFEEGLDTEEIFDHVKNHLSREEFEKVIKEAQDLGFFAPQEVTHE